MPVVRETAIGVAYSFSGLLNGPKDGPHCRGPGTTCHAIQPPGSLRMAGHDLAGLRR